MYTESLAFKINFYVDKEDGGGGVRRCFSLINDPNK